MAGLLLAQLSLAGPLPAAAHDAAAVALQVSSSAGRSPSSSLSGATLRGAAHVFLPPPSGTREVAFWLDDEAMAGPARQVERAAPYDFAGGTAGAATAFDTTRVAEGSHTISARVVHTDGHVETGSATFTVDNVPDPAPGTTLRIDAGGPGATTGGQSWSADTGASGGKTYANPAVTAIAGTTDDVLYRTERSATTDRGSFRYALPAPVAGTYTVRVHMAEIWWGAPGGGPGGAGRRVFSVDLEGGAVELPGYDVFADVGAATAVVKTLSTYVADGTLDVTFAASVNQPTVAALEVVAPSGPTPPPPAGDPTPFTWESRTPAPTGRSEGQGAAVDGKLYVFGGFSTGTTTSPRSDVLDPATGTWTRLPDMPEQLTHSPAVVDGTTVWLVGGYVGNHPGPATTSVWRFDTVRRTWSRGPSLPARRGAGAAAVVGRQLHFFGGTDRVAGSTADPDRPDHWVLDLATAGATWQRRAGLPNPRNHLSGATVDGKVYAIGGQHNEDETNGLQADVHRFDPATGAWQQVASLPGARSHAVTVVRDGKVLVLGGTDPGNVASSAVTAYDPATGVWAALPRLPGGRKTPVAALIGGAVWVSGGSHATSTWAGRFTDRWETGPAAPVALGEVAGGVIGSTLYQVGEGSSVTLALDLATGRWRTGLAVRPFVGHHAAAEVLGGRLYLFGGLGSGAGKVQVYDPVANRWTLGPDMPFAAGSSSSAVIGGQVYVAGGIVGSTTTTRAARFDPARGTWTALADMPQGRNHAASATDGARLWVFGGRGPGSGDGNSVANGFDTVQVYDPATGRWTSSATPGSGLRPLPQARGGTGKAVFTRGELYVMGGETATGAGATDRRVYARVDVYDPVRGTWRLGTPMPTARHGVFPVLHAGRITVAGGGVQAGSSSSSVVETYTPGG